MLLPVTAAAGEISISAELSQARISFDKRDTLTIMLVWEGEPSAFEIAEFPMPILEKLKILGSSTSVSTGRDSSAAGGERTTRTYRYILEPTDFGTGVIQPLTVTAQNRVTQAEHLLHTGRMSVEIDKPKAKIKKSDGGGGFYVILGGVLVVLSIMGLVFYKRRKRTNNATDGETTGNLYQDKLLEIKKESVGDGKRFYSRTYRLLLQYLEKECQLEVSGKTGREVLEVIKNVESDEERVHLQHFLNEALEVKFRPQEPGPGDVADSYNALLAFFESRVK